MFGYNHSPLLDQLIDQLELKWVPKLPEDGVHYNWISFPTARFLDGLWYLYQNRPNTKFLEVGCGIGTKMILANMAGFEVTGLELRPEYIEVAKELCSNFDFEPEIIQADALEFDRYGEFDCIYSYTPFSDRELDKQLKLKIGRECQPSALLFFPGDNYLEELGWRKTIHEVWIK